MTQNVLIIEDDRLVADLIAHRPDRDAYNIQSISNGDDAINSVRSFKPHLVVLDGLLPGMDGFEVLPALKSDSETKNVAVLMLTARDLEEDIVGGLDLGADDYMVKPFMPDELSSRVKRLLRSASSGAKN